MAAKEPQFSSLDGTALGGQVVLDLPPSLNAVARRSISIFSRRGTETPEPKPPFIIQAAIRSPKQMSERQMNWLKKKPSLGKSKSTKQTETIKHSGTVLNAVPPAKKITMTALEEEMATAPNEEILSAISKQSLSHPAFRTSPLQTSSDQEQIGFWNQSETPLSRRTKSAKLRETNTRIGVWRNGIVHWDHPARQECCPWEEPGLVERELGLTPLNSSLFGVSDTSERPLLTVVIPRSEPLINDATISTLVQPIPRHPAMSVARASKVSKYAFSTPTINVFELHNPSPRSSCSILPTPPAVRPKAPIYEITDDAGPLKTSHASSSDSSETEKDDASVSSNCSSTTSVEAVAALDTPQEGSQEKSNTSNVLDHAPNIRANLNKPLPPNPNLRTICSVPVLTSSPNSFSFISYQKSPRRSSSIVSAPAVRKGNDLVRARRHRSSQSLTQLETIDQEFIRSSPYGSTNRSPSPTLSEAEDELQARLLTIDEMDVTTQYGKGLGSPTVSRFSSVRYSDSVQTVMRPERVPTLPKRSRKRDWKISSDSSRMAQMAIHKALARRRSESEVRPLTETQREDPLVKTLRKSLSTSKIHHMHGSTLTLPTGPSAQNSTATPLLQPEFVIDDGLIVVDGPTIMYGTESEETWAAVSAASAEDVLLHILSSLQTTEDLFNTAIINKGMYRVFKENEMELIRTVTFNQSPAAWEFRQWSQTERLASITDFGEANLFEQTPNSYMRRYRGDLAVIESLKKLILERCQTFIRRGTAFALTTPGHPNAQRFNDAFWRIWCFCEIFGCEKRREDDITGQLDWLKGGLLATNQDCVATMNINLDFDMSSVLLNAPDFFAKGNAGGLSAQRLYDMTEIWTCFTSLLQGFHGRIDQARECGVFMDCDVQAGDVEREAHLLEEWTSYLLTLGPKVVLEMAQFANDDSSAGFSLAQTNGWTKWSPPRYSGSRETFLKEPVARIYEERVAAAATRLQNPREQEKKEMSRKRVATLAAEIKLARQASSFKRLPLIDMNSERAMSIISRRNGTVDSRHSSICSISSLRSSRRASSPSGDGPEFTISQPGSPLSNLWLPRKISPIIEDRVENFNRLGIQHFEGLSENTSEYAIMLIVDLGFSVAQAQEALRLTDRGDGLRVDRAVELLRCQL